MKKEINLKQGSILVMAAYIIVATLFYLIAHEQLTYRTVSEEIRASNNQTPVGEITEGMTVVQPFVSQADTLDGVSLLTATYDRINTGELIVQIINMESDAVLAEKVLDLQTIPNNSVAKVSFDNPVRDIKGENLGIKLTSNGTQGNAITIWQNNDLTKGQALLLDGQQTDQNLCYAVSGRDLIWFGQNYLLVALLAGAILGAYLLRLILIEKKEKTCLGLRLIAAFKKYKFLLSQLVARDFKTKYKRSVLGVLWSFLNPLLTMLVQYIVFSNLFKFDIPNFAVYLLIGIVFFNFFQEAVSMSLMSIVGNASLITKVYMPKYIYPVSRVLSSTINFLLSMIPLILVVALTNTPFTMSYVLLLFSMSCIIIFSIGLGMLLSAAMVYFRDTQFLWNVLSMLWMYATPIIYPKSIIPNHYSFIYEWNPLYYFIDFSRTVIMQGVSPEPIVYLYCLISAFGMLGIGAWVFKKTQNGFVLHI